MHLDKNHEIKKLRFKTKRVSYVVSEASETTKETWCFDIRAQTRDGRAIDVEVQNLHHSFFEDRVLTYGSALLLKAKAEKKERRLQAYELPGTISVWVCNFAVPEYSTEPWDDWMIYSGNDLRNGRLLPISERIKYIFIQLPNFKKRKDELNTVEDQWIYVLKHAFSSTAEIDIQNDAVTEALERIRAEETDEGPDMITKKERDCTIATIEDDAERRGIQIGETRGEARGIQIGEARLSGALESLGVAPEIIAKACEIANSKK